MESFRLPAYGSGAAFVVADKVNGPEPLTEIGGGLIERLTSRDRALQRSTLDVRSLPALQCL